MTCAETTSAWTEWYHLALARHIHPGDDVLGYGTVEDVIRGPHGAIRLIEWPIEPDALVRRHRPGQVTVREVRA